MAKKAEEKQSTGPKAEEKSALADLAMLTLPETEIRARQAALELQSPLPALGKMVFSRH